MVNLLPHEGELYVQAQSRDSGGERKPGVEYGVRHRVISDTNKDATMSPNNAVRGVRGYGLYAQLRDRLKRRVEDGERRTLRARGEVDEIAHGAACQPVPEVPAKSTKTRGEPLGEPDAGASKNSPLPTVPAQPL